MRRFLNVSFLLILPLAGLALWWFCRPTPLTPPPTGALPAPFVRLSEPPDWQLLHDFQFAIGRADFEQLLDSVFTQGGAWRPAIQTDETSARIATNQGNNFRLNFGPFGFAAAPPRHWRTAAELPPTTASRPLANLRVAIDPGHIGGRWAQIEERWFAVENDPPVCEGDLTLLVAQLLKPRLEALGATVTLVRSNNEPVTPLRPESLLPLARQTGPPDSSAANLQKLAERLFYRTAEIHARAQVVNRTLQPDLVLCLHFNADSWGDPHHPTLVSRSHLHLLVNGAYTDDELALEDQRYEMLVKLLRGSHQEETSIAATIASTFAAASGLPPFRYPAGSPNAIAIPGQPYLWARNLLANRLYDCPVIFMEPYVMNSHLDYPRLQAGDYPGVRAVAGKSQPSIFREYADALAAGLARHYGARRKSMP